MSNTITEPTQSTLPTNMITSGVLKQVANQLRSGRHPLISGAIGDLVLLRGEALTVHEALERMASGPFDVVLRMNAIDGLEVIHGEDDYKRAINASNTGAEVCRGDSPESDLLNGNEPHLQDGDPQGIPDRERRLRALRARKVNAHNEDPITIIRRCLTQCEVSVLVICDQTDISLQDPAQHQQPDRDRVAALQLGLRQAARVGRYRNTCVLIAGDSAQIPPVLLDGCEDIVPVDMGTPSREERTHFLETHVQHMHDGDRLDEAGQRGITEELAKLTDGEPLGTLDSLVEFSRNGKHSVLQPRVLVNLHRFGDRPDYWSHLRAHLKAACDDLNARVFGQPAAVDAVMASLAAAAMGLDLSGDETAREGQPKGLLWFVGPTGVGKTELAKAIARVVYGDAEAYVRLDMTTFAQEHSAERLTGASPGYVGFEQGGELTEAVRRRPACVILLDEIEKAHPRVLDRFMSIFDDGRVTDAQGRVTYFSEAIIIATSNVGAGELMQVIERDGDLVTYADVAEICTAAVREEFVRIDRPEIFGRIKTGVVPFDILRPEMVDQIAMRFIESITFRNGPCLDLDPMSTCAMVRKALEDPSERALGGRQVRNVLRSRMADLTAWLAANGHTEPGEVRVDFDGDQMFASVDGAPAVAAG